MQLICWCSIHPFHVYTHKQGECVCVYIHTEWYLYTYVYLCIFNLISVDGQCLSVTAANVDGEDALYGWFGSLGNLHCVVEDVFLPSRLRWVGSYNKEFRGNIPVLVGLWCGGLGKAGVWGIHWKESSWHELRRSSVWAALVGFRPCLYLVLQWGFWDTGGNWELMLYSVISQSMEALCKLPHWNNLVSAQILKSILRISRWPTFKNTTFFVHYFWTRDVELVL